MKDQIVISETRNEMCIYGNLLSNIQYRGSNKLRAAQLDEMKGDELAVTAVSTF